jgi:hypothetical protein
VKPLKGSLLKRNQKELRDKTSFDFFSYMSDVRVSSNGILNILHLLWPDPWVLIRAGLDEI